MRASPASRSVTTADPSYAVARRRRRARRSVHQKSHSHGSGTRSASGSSARPPRRDRDPADLARRCRASVPASSSSSAAAAARCRGSLRVAGQPGGPAQAAAVPPDPGDRLAVAGGDRLEGPRVELEPDVGVVVERLEEAAVQVVAAGRRARASRVNPGMSRVRRPPRVLTVTASLFDEGTSSSRATAPLAVRMRPRTLDDLVGQQHLLLPGQPAAPPDQLGAGRRSRPDERDPVGPSGHRQDHARLAREHLDRAPLRRALGRHRRGEGRPRGRRARPRLARHARHRHRAVRRRGPPVLQDPAGRPAARGRERVGHARGRHHGEPVVLGHLPAALALARPHAVAAVGRRRARPDPSGRDPTRAASTARSRSRRRPRTTCCASPAATRGAR